MKKNNKIISWLVIIVLFLFIAAETSYLNNKNIFFEKMGLVEMLLGSLSIVVLLFTLPYSLNNKGLRVFVKIIHAILITGILFLILLEASIVDFSGKGFGVEVAYHIEWQAFILGIKEYALPLFFMCVFIILIIHAVFSINLAIPFKYKLFSFLLSIAVLIIYFNATILGRVYQGYSEYRDAQSIPEANIDDVNRFNSFGISASSLLKNDINAEAGNKNNIIVIYLESFSDVFTTSKKYKDLTVNINKLKNKYSNMENYYSSAGFTMDGLISSNCGFIPNMVSGNSTLSTGVKPYFLLPCATDVLKKAGYYQEFLGGAKKSFAGKEDFFLDHGVDKVWGWEDFKLQEQFKDNHSWWGLHDDDLFDFALNRIKELKNKEPFNFNILTLSTHLKGFASPSCKKYPNEENRYLDAIYCTDQLLGKFIDQLEKEDILENTTVIITGDHGVFNTSIVHNLFGKNNDLHKLLGIVIRKDKSNIIQPLALYDLGAIILDLLQIKTNTEFIFSSGLKKLPNKIVFRHDKYFNNGEWQYPSKDCETKQDKFTLPLNKCDYNEIIQTVYGFVSTFRITLGIEYQSTSDLIVKFNHDESRIIDVVLNGKSLLGKTYRNGFIIEPYLLSRKGVFIIFINNKEHILLNPFSFATGERDRKEIGKFVKLNNQHSYVIFSNKHRESIELMSLLKDDYMLNCKTENYCFSRHFDFDELIIEKTIEQNLNDLYPKKTDTHFEK